MSKAKSGDTVRVHYTGKLDDGTQFDSSAGKDPLEFAIGSGGVLPAFDSEVEGMTVGDSKSFKIEAEDAYGRRHDQLIQDVPREHLPEDMDPAVGMQLQAQGQDGQPINLVVTEVKDDTITVDGNHPLAGQALSFDIELVEIA
ncbi:MAG: FKBP-type peptidyl-prolyl cis-trans isomerase [Woeseiaceae bacterium]